MGVVSRRWMWVESIGVASGCGCNVVYRFPHNYYLYLLLLYMFFTGASLLFVHLFNKTFFVLVHVLL